jgi:hypothetical protein
MPSGQDYASRLREETRKTLATHIRGVEDGLRSFQESLSASLAPIARQLGSILDIEVPGAAGVLSEAVAEEVRESERRRSEDLLDLARFAHKMRRMETQDEILNALLDGAHRYAPRLALFVTRGSQFRGWSSRGYGQDTVQKIAQRSLVLSECPVLRRALEADALTTVNDLASEPALSELFGQSLEGPLHAFPMKAIGRPVAILLASAASGRACDLESLCILMDLTGLCVENLALKILHEMKLAGASAPAQAAPRAVPQPAAPAVVVSMPESVPGVPPAPPPAAVPALALIHAERATEAATEETAAVQAAAGTEAAPVAEVALPAGDATPAEKTEAQPAEVEPVPAKADADSPPDTGRQSVAGGTVLQEPVRTSALREVQPLTEEEKLHADAKRFARLLASEIKLYNEQRVQEGRANRDLYVRLKRDIDRSRDMYEKRVSPLVSRKVDYFHDEIIRVLGDNDPSTLGSDYPGPRVES